MISMSILLSGNGKGSAAIKDGVMTITSEEEGTEDYSVQLVQAKVPMIKGKKYKLSFDASAAEERDMITCVSALTAPGRNQIHPRNNTKLNITE